MEMGRCMQELRLEHAEAIRSNSRFHMKMYFCIPRLNIIIIIIIQPRATTKYQCVPECFFFFSIYHPNERTKRKEYFYKNDNIYSYSHSRNI